MLWRPAYRTQNHAALFAGVTSFDTDAETYFSAIVTNGGTEPDTTRKTVINNLITGLKSDGIWTKITWLSLLAANDSPAARLNIKNTSQICSAVNSPTFTSDRGFTGDGSTASLDTGIQGNTIAGEDSCLFVHVRTRGSTDADIAGFRSAFSFLRSSTVTTTVSGAWRGSAQSTLASSAADNQFIAVRRTTGVQSLVVGTTIDTNDTVTVNSTSLTNPIWFLRSSGSHTNGQLSIGGWSTYLDDTEILNLRTRLNTYLTAVGAL